MTSPNPTIVPPRPTTSSGASGHPALRTVLAGSGKYSPEEIDAYIEFLEEKARADMATTGQVDRALAAQINDAKKARQNAMAIARLSAETSRYGTDVGRQNMLDQLEQNQRQFEANHGLEIQKVGLQRAQTATDYLSTPDRYIQAGNYLNLSSRVLAGQPGSAPYGQAGTPQAKSMDDFAVLESGGIPGRQVDPAAVAAGAGGGSDARVKALQAVMKASPPSTGDGLDANDFAVLSAARSIYGMNLNPQQQASFKANPEATAIHSSAGRRLGYNPDAWWSSQRRSLPGQGASNRA